MWKKITDRKVRHVWACHNENCGVKNEKDRTAMVPPTFYAAVGTPVCDCGYSMEYVRTEIQETAPIGLVSVVGGVATVASSSADIHVVDVDNIKAGDPMVYLPKGVGFEKLVRFLGVQEYVNFVKNE